LQGTKVYIRCVLVCHLEHKDRVGFCSFFKKHPGDFGKVLALAGIDLKRM